ncbi:MAG: DmsE family decaheme c-type cytochrome [Rubrivivax sp.]|nr:DmsE family decaheme c-type cytochrome [Rubrivivax sp.]
MRALPVLAAFLLCLGGLSRPAWALQDAEVSKACVECHDENDLPDMSRSAHAVTTDARTPDCVSCHGRSPEHVDKPEKFKPETTYSKNGGSPASERSASCLTCHGSTMQHMLWAGSAHDTADVACSSCHKVHANQDRVLSKITQPEVCYTCHKEQRTQMLRPSHHPVPEGQMACSDCHNAHGSTGPKLALRDSTNQTCYTCHAEKRGPFVHEHEPVTEDCSICHNPHGSTVAALLKVRAPILCQECHTPHVAGDVGAVGGQPGVYPPAAPGQFAPAITANSGGKNVVNMWQGRSCMNCHTQVHGSNNPSATNPTPHFLFR